MANFHLLIDVLLDHVQRHVARPFDHDLNVMLPSDLGQLAECLQFCELRRVISISDGAWAKTVA
ncbi:hypothetical protein D3C84_1100450 [compost metagenome]